MKKAGFTLVELSIVLLIMALVVGGVMTGRLLIESAETRQLMKRYEEINLSIKAFQLKYNAIPGDMNNATTMWGAVASPPGQTANGNGDGLVLGCGDETRRAFEHLTLAELYPGSYNPDGASPSDAIGVTFPATPYALHGIRVISNTGLTGPYIRYNYKNIISYGQVGATCLNTAPTIHTDIELYEIDRKFDDGKPTTGRILGWGCIDSWITAFPNYTAAGTACAAWYPVE